jgi:hypothetical protein
MRYGTTIKALELIDDEIRRTLAQRVLVPSYKPNMVVTDTQSAATNVNSPGVVGASEEI